MTEIIAIEALDIEDQHERALEDMTEAQKLAMAREILAVKIAVEGAKSGVKVSRRESLEAVFQAEASAVNLGAKPQVDFFLPIDNELPLKTNPHG